jgi:hypothetical protein
VSIYTPHIFIDERSFEFVNTLVHKSFMIIGSGNLDLNEKSERRKKRDESKYIYVITHVFLAEFVKNKTLQRRLIQNKVQI